MMNSDLKVVVCSRSFSKHPMLRKTLLSKYRNVKFNDAGLRLKGDALIDFLTGYDAAIIALETISYDVLKELPLLRAIGKYGVGLDKLDFDAMEEFGVRLGWTPGVNAQSVAELTLALALNVIRHIPMSNAIARRGEWRQIKGRQLSAMTYGILGCGHVGKALVKILSGFGCNILAHDIVDYTDFYHNHGVESVPLEDLLARSDILSVHIPKNRTTENLLNKSRIALMKAGAYLINTARGGIVDEKAVIEALDNKQLSSVAFDVLLEEPPINNAMVNHPHSFVTTHISGSSEEAILAMGLAAIDGLTVHYPAKFFDEFK